MKAVILAGGLGTRLSEETQVRPKPMVEVGGNPLLWHLMNIYSGHGVHEFIICVGYKGYVIKEYFVNYSLHTSNIRVDLTKGTVDLLDTAAEPWTITVVDTGDNTMTGGRLRRIKKYVGDEPFCMTYGDGVGNVDISREIEFHRAHGRLATVTSVAPPGRFGALNIENGRVTSFREKPLGEGGLINGGFFVLSPKCLDYIAGDHVSWEREPMERLAEDGQLMSFRHDGFWQPVDTLRDKHRLEELWQSGEAPWKTW